MSNPDEEEFKIEQNHKKFSIIISIQEEQLSLILIILSNRPKKFSGFYSLNELRISSKIFQHTTTLFEAKEIIKRTVIKKQLLIDDDEFKAKITFDTGLGYDSIPFPIILFRDSDDKGPRISTLIKKYDNNDNFKDCEDNLKKSFINKHRKKNTTFIQNNIPVNGNNNNVLRASIGNNVNNKILNNVNSNGNIQFNNSMKVLTSSKILSDNNINNNTRNPILQNNKKLKYKEVTKFGDEEDDKEKENSHQTCTGENIDMNRPINKDIENNELNKPTDFGDNKDMNQGAGFNKPNDMGDNYNGFNFSNGDLELSQSVVLGELSKEKIAEYLQNGYFPLFFKINNYSPRFFFIKETSTLKSLAREYVRNCPQTDDGILENIEFYWKDKQLNKDLQIKYLQLKPCSVITNKAS